MSRITGKGFTNRAIARSCSIGRATVGEYLRRATGAGLSWPLPEGLDEADLERNRRFQSGLS